MSEDRPLPDAQPGAQNNGAARSFPFPVSYEYSVQREPGLIRRYGIRELAARIAIGIALIPVILVPLYWIVPPVSTLMLWRWVTLQRVERVWTPISEISPHVVRMVVAGEDGRFCSHAGVDWRELQSVIDEYAEEGDARGASTIPMQVAKNLFLWPGRQVIRKALEVPLAYYMSAIWSKRRMMEIYLNIAEWGPEGEFGVEAASRRFFKKPSRDLSAHEAALLAGALPNPLARNPQRPGPQLSRAAQTRLRIAGNNGPGAVSCVIPRG
ncbi:MAG: transglycosylase domain-containing protein [Rhizobiales bacterium]|nr:transglycosylase domain-containing protein [Hyphomicrobiales bacterium]